MLLCGPRIQLLPFEPSHWEHVARWAYSPEHRAMWRHSPNFLNSKDFVNYPAHIGGMVFMIYLKETRQVIGMVQAVPDWKTNRGAYIGIVLDTDFQNSHFTHEALVLLFNHLFNRCDYRKVIVELLAENKDFKLGLIKAGFLLEGTFFKEAFVDGNYCDEVRLSMSSSYFNSHYLQIVKTWETSSENSSKQAQPLPGMQLGGQSAA